MGLETVVGSAALVPGPQQPFVAGAAGVVAAVEGFFGHHSGVSAHDVARANNYILGARNGNVTSARYLIGGSYPHVAAPQRQLYIDGEAQVKRDFPAIIAQAHAEGALHDDAAGTQGILLLRGMNLTPFSDAAAPESPVQQVVSELVNNVRGAAAQAVAQIGAGSTAAAVNAVQPAGAATAIVIPTSTWMVSGVVLAVGALLLLLMRKRNA